MSSSSEHETSLFFIILTALLLGITALLILIGNTFVLLILRRINTCTFNDVTKLLLKSLTLSDLMVGIFVVPAAAANMGYWANGRMPFGDIFMIVYIKVNVFTLLSGLLSLMVITIERYIAVVYSLRYTTIVTRNRARITVAIIWLVSGVFGAVAHPLDSENNQDSGNMTKLMNTSITELSGSERQSEQMGEITWSTIIILVAVPVLITLIFSIKLYMIARKHAVQIEAQRRQFQVCKKDYKGAVTFCVVAGAFALAWLPNLALSLYRLLSYNNEKHSDVPPFYYFFVRVFIFCNSWWNVLIYYMRNNSFRSAAKTILFGRQNRPDDSTAAIDRTD